MTNNLTARKDGQWLVISMLPDVCKTPIGGTDVPVPYPIIAKCGDAAHEAPHVRANGMPFITLASYLPTTTGAVAGVKKGIVSDTVGGTASFKKGQHSTTVNADKQRILRHGDMFWMNGEATGKAPSSPSFNTTKKPKKAGPGKWLTTDVNKRGIRNLLQILAIRTKTIGDTGRMMGSDGGDGEGTVRDVTQTWTELTASEAQGLSESGLTSTTRNYGETRVITQMFLEDPDAWSENGKSWYWQPEVPREDFDFIEPQQP